MPCFSLEPSPETSPTLKWYSLNRYNREAGEVLAAFELFLLVREIEFFSIVYINMVC